MKLGRITFGQIPRGSWLGEWGWGFGDREPAVWKPAEEALMEAGQLTGSALGAQASQSPLYLTDQELKLMLWAVDEAMRATAGDRISSRWRELARLLVKLEEHR